MRVQNVPANFKYPEIKKEHFRFGSSPLTGPALNESGNWLPYVPEDEDQNIRGIESSACFVEGQQHTIATIEEKMFGVFGENNNNYSARFNALLSGGTPTGGDPLKAADSFRHDGLVKQESMPFGTEIQSWDDFHSWKGVDEAKVRAQGKAYLMRKEIGYDIVCEKCEPVATKYLKLKQALKYSPCPVSVSAWFHGQDGCYYKPQGMDDNHLVELVYIDDDNCAYVRDTYAPYLKKLEPFYDFDFGMRYTVKIKTQQEQLSTLRQILLNILDWIRTQRLRAGAIIRV